MGGAIGVFLGGAPFGGHAGYKTRTAFTFPAKALRQIECAGAKAWFCLRKNLIEYYLVIPTERSEWRDLVQDVKAGKNTVLCMASP